MHDALVGGKVDASGAGADTGSQIERIDASATSAAAGGGAANSGIPAPSSERKRGNPEPTTPPSDAVFEPPPIPKLERSGPIEMDNVSIDSDSIDSVDSNDADADADADENVEWRKESAMSSGIPAPAPGGGVARASVLPLRLGRRCRRGPGGKTAPHSAA